MLWYKIKPGSEVIVVNDKRIAPKLFPRVTIKPERNPRFCSINAVIYREYVDDLLHGKMITLKPWMKYWLERRYIMFMHLNGTVDYYFVSEDDVIIETEIPND